MIMQSNLRIVYMGTPEFAVEPLRRLLDAGCNVVGVVTMPDKPQGRGYKLQPSAVKQFAVERGLPVLQPEKLKNEGFLQQLRDLRADLQIVVAFRMLPEVVWNMPPKGTFNLHASLLPQYRGAAPINWAIINGETKTGVTTFFLKHEIDTGDIILQREVAIDGNDDAGSLHDKLMELGAQTVVDTVELIETGNVSLQKQDESVDLKPAPKIFKPDCRIDFDQSSENVRNFVRGLSPYPAAFTEIEDEKGNVHTLKVFSCEIANADAATPGTLSSDGKTYLSFATRNGAVSVKRVQLSGKKPMDITDFLRGFRPKIDKQNPT